MTTECSRAWQAEAALDGRLSRADTESFQRHAATCECCTREVRSLEILRSVGQRLPILTSTPLEQRRLRQSMLRAANELALQPRRTPGKHIVALALAAAVVVLLLVFWLPARHQNVPGSAAGVPTYRIQTSPGAAWTSHTYDQTLRLVLENGRFDISVDKLGTGQRFLLEVPDGELEVKGTRFSVEVHDAQTARVRVYEGRVAVRLRGEAALLLEAGDTWPGITAAASPPRTTRAAEGPALPSVPDQFRGDTGDARPPTKTARARVIEAPPALPSRDTGGALESSPAGAPTVSGDAFAQAMSAFTAGDFGKAERLFTAFEQAHPADARVEDATFLRAVARARRGDTSAARAIAREYLRRYPKGLRRAEAERLAR